MTMSLEGKFSWEFLNNIANTLDSYRIRALIDAKEDILSAGIYNEAQYKSLLFQMFEQEQKKYALFDYIKKVSSISLETFKGYSMAHSMPLREVLALLVLLHNEKLIQLTIIHETIEGTEEIPPKQKFKDISITPVGWDITKIKSIYEPVKVIFDAKACSGCGICAGICPVNCLKVNNGFGLIDEEKCIRCGLCYFSCPRTYLPTELIYMLQEGSNEIKAYPTVGHFIEAFSARSKVKEIAEVCQDGGISSTCLYHLFNSKKITHALGAKMSNTPWRPETTILKSKEEIISTAGTKYVNNANLRDLNKLNNEQGPFAVVGVPCQMQALRKSKLYNIGLPALNKIEYNIGIFCMESFSYQSIMKICEILKVDLKKIKKMDINKGKFFVYNLEGEEFSVPIKEISHLAREDCELCFDLTSESADISVGSIGSPSGWNTVLIRTQKGKKLFQDLISNDLIEVKPIEEVKPGLPLLLKIAGSKRTKCSKHVDSKVSKNERFPKYSL